MRFWKSASDMDVVTRVDADNLDAIPWQELWRFRELFVLLAWRDFIVRYKQTAVGILWAIIEPLVRMVVMHFVFNIVADMENDLVVIYAGLMPWQLFRNSLNTSSLSLVQNRGIVAKIYFPRLIMPSASIMVNFVDFIIQSVILIALMLALGYEITPRLLLLPFLVVLAGFLALGIGLFISTLYVRYRDFKIVLPFLLEIGVFITPVGYQSTDVPPEVQTLYALNPVTGIVDAFRWAILGQADFNGLAMAVSMVMTLLVMYFGLRFFRHSERWFADII